MTDIRYYNNDGANWQAQAVLAYLRNYAEVFIDQTYNKEYRRYEATISAGRFENCREQGYIVSVSYKGEQRNYAFYEHRNSDSICVVKFDQLTINTPTLEDVCNRMSDKYDYTKSFDWGEILACGEWIGKDIENFVTSIKEEKMKEGSDN